MIKSILQTLVFLLVHSPFYPHWLDFRNRTRGNRKSIQYLKGKVLETGAGNCQKKEWILSQNKKIKEYVATDYSSWDNSFDTYNKRAGILGSISEIIFGKVKQASKLDLVCDAMNLPFEDDSFDGYCSFEVLEHISDPYQFLSEAYRVTKKGGYVLITTPYIYREHGGMNFDFQRISRGGYHYLAKKVGFSKIKIFTHSFFGTTLAILVNQYVIRKISESKIAMIFLLPLSPLIFFSMNIFGFIIDSLDKDIRFASAYHVILKK